MITSTIYMKNLISLLRSNTVNTTDVLYMDGVCQILGIGNRLRLRTILLYVDLKYTSQLP